MGPAASAPQTAQADIDSRSRLVDELRNEVDRVIAPLIDGSPEQICIIDPPGYPNVGDSAIFLGQIDFIKRKYPRARISFADGDCYSEGLDRFIEKSSLIIINGGGNFGDLWMHHQNMRNRVLERFRNVPVIQMPQSIFFKSDDEMKKTAALIGNHPNFVLLVRDQNSLQYATRNFDCEIHLCPDMAFAMNPIRRKPPSMDYYCLLRTDKEIATDHDKIRAALAGVQADFEIGDWLGEFNSRTYRADRFATRLTRKKPGLTAPARELMAGLRRRFAEERLAYGIDLLSRGKMVITDRLHAHILSTLLGIPHLIFDSFDGKISAFHDCWTKGRSPGTLLASPAELAEHIRGRTA